jgi:TrmH family RNA methyltransferase
MENLSSERLRFLVRLKQKKFRLAEGMVIVEGQRTLEQLSEWGLFPKELYLQQDSSVLKAGKYFHLSPQAMARICESENPAGIAGLFDVPMPRQIDFRQAFYLEQISDPGNLGTIFRTAAAFGVESLIMSPSCCEISTPKVIRASLGAVYRVPFFYQEPGDLVDLKAELVYLDMDGTISIADFRPTGKSIIAIGNEAHGLSQILKNRAKAGLNIPMPGNMESLNAAISFAIAAYCLSHP